MRFRARLVLLLFGCMLGASLHAQPVFTAADFQHLVGAHTRISTGAGNPAPLTSLTHLAGGPHVFDLTDISWGSSTVQDNVPVACGAAYPGCQDDYLGRATAVLRIRQDGGDVFRFYDLTDDGFYDRGSAGAADGAGVVVEGVLALDAPDRVLAFPLTLGSTWTNHATTRLQADGVVSVSSQADCTRDVTAWGTLRTADHETSGLLVRERCVTTLRLDEQVLLDTSEAFRFVSPTLWATLEMDAGGQVRSASVEVFDVVATAVAAETVASGVLLHLPWPNPSRGATAVSFSLDAAAPVTLDVFDVLGRHVAHLADGIFPAGLHTRTWAGAAPSGLYIVRLRAGRTELTRTLTRVD